MAYYIEPTDRGNLPAGRNWMLLEEPGGDVRFVVARSAEPFEIPPCVLEAIVAQLAQADCLDPWRVVSRAVSA